MQKKNVQRRRRLTTSVRKRITSYYTETEQQEIAAAATAHGVSLSSFIASVALKDLWYAPPHGFDKAGAWVLAMQHMSTIGGIHATNVQGFST